MLDRFQAIKVVYAALPPGKEHHTNFACLNTNGKLVPNEQMEPIQNQTSTGMKMQPTAIFCVVFYY